MSKRTRPESKHLYLHCGKLINPSTDSVMKNVYLEINNGKIFNISHHQPVIAADAELMDYSGKTIIPGLFDTHSHFFGGGLIDEHVCDELLAKLFLAGGVTSVRIPGSMEPDTDLALRDRIDTGHFDGPRLFLSGVYLDMPTGRKRWMDEMDTAEEVRLKIDDSIGKGATSVKIYAHMYGDILKSAIDHGHAHGVRVIAHIGAVSYREAIDMGIDELFHGIICCPETWPEDMKSYDFRRVFDVVPGLDLHQTSVPGMLQRAKEAGVFLTPTAVVILPIDLNSRTQTDQKRFYSPEAWELFAKKAAEPETLNMEGLFKKQLEFIRMAYEVGCILTTGTDITDYTRLPGFSLYDEMEIFGMAGIPNMDILKAATCNSACAIGRSDLLGAILPGKLADLVILDADPLENISNIREVHRVIKAGVVYDPQELYKPLEGKIR